MPARPRPSRWLSLALVLVACGDSGGTTAGAPTTTITSATTTTTSGSSSAPGTAQSSGEPTTSAGSETATTDDSTTGPPDTTTTGEPGTTTTTGGVSSTTTGETTDPGTGTSTGTTGGPVCGDGVVEPGETCDDGSGAGCDTYHDGGDGVCVPPGTCSEGHVLAGEDCVPELWVEHVHIYVSNTCEMMVEPTSFEVQPGQKLRLDYHNHSADYPVDVWMHYGGGYTELQPGATWMEQYEHCFGPNPSEGWAEISTACSEVVLPISCL